MTPYDALKNASPPASPTPGDRGATQLPTLPCGSITNFFGDPSLNVA